MFGGDRANDSIDDEPPEFRYRNSSNGAVSRVSGLAFLSATIRSHLKHPVKHLADVLLVTPAIVVINHEGVQFLVAAKLLALSTSTSMNRFFGCDRQ